MAGQNPPFGSPAWRAKYGKKAPAPAAGSESAAKVAAIRSKAQRNARGGGRRRQPINELAQAISYLESAIKIEPEAADKEMLEGCLHSMKAIQGKNEAEQREG